MVEYTPVDYDPFAQDASINAYNAQFTPVEHDPFGNASHSKYYLASHGVETAAPSETQPKPIEQILSEAKDYREHAYKQLLDNSDTRYQTFPERIARNVGDIITGGQPAYNPSTGQYNVEGAMDIAGLMGGAPLVGAAEKGAVVGSGAIRRTAEEFPTEAYHGTPTPGFEKFKTPEAGQYMSDTLMSDTQKPGIAIASAGHAQPFYSAVENAVNNISQPKMTGQQWLGTIGNKPGVKPEEMDFTGLKGFLEENGNKPVTKQEIQNYISENKVQVNEVNKGFTSYDKTRLNELDKKLRTNGKLEGDEIKEYDRLSEAENLPRTGQQATKYQSYQLPGAENYREKLFTLPDPNVLTIKQAIAKRDNLWEQLKQSPDFPSDSNEMYKVKWARENQPDLYKQWSDANAISNNRKVDSDAGYRSSHWDEPNVLAHVRMNDRVINGDKSLHLEEIQSDWHQAGRDRGYKNPDMPIAKRQKEIENRLDEIISNRIKNNNPRENQPEYENLYNELISNQKAEAVEKKGVPDAPFKKTWPDLVIKRMVREAAENGYDKLSWTPGEAQAARYDLSKQIKKVQFDKSGTSGFTPRHEIESNDSGLLHAYDHNGRQVINKYVNVSELPDYIGKEAAEKLMQQEGNHQVVAGTAEVSRKLSGVDLKVGGEGMKGFYDQIIPKIVEKITGQKVKTAKIDVSGGKPLNSRTHSENDGVENVHYIDIPQKLKDTAMQKGFPLFSGGIMMTPVDHNPFGNQNDQ